MRKRTWGFVLGGLLVALLLAGVVSNYASSHPDGLDSALLKGCTVNAHGQITGGSCPAQQAKGHELADGPLAGYGIRGVDNKFLSTGLSGIAGVLLTFALGGGLFWLARRRGPGTGGPADQESTGVDRADPEGPTDVESDAAIDDRSPCGDRVR